jgi:hypothetical protein
MHSKVCLEVTSVIDYVSVTITTIKLQPTHPLSAAADPTDLSCTTCLLYLFVLCEDVVCKDKKCFSFN